MLFGHNTNVTVGDKQYHVQTEDRGTGRAIIDTMVYCGGRVMHRRTNSYGDLLPLDEKSEQKLRLRLNGQHRAVLDELRAGTLKLSSDGAAKQSPAGANAKPAANAAAGRAQGNSIALQLVNAKSWLSGRRATLQVTVRDDDSGAEISGARVVARIDGAAEPAEFSTATGTQGQARLAFDMPRLGAGEAALVIEASHGAARGHLRFQLRAKPKVPAAG
jgi:hypothetical protein